MDASNSEDRYSFEYWGKDLESPLGWNKANAVCAATFWLPTEFLEEHGPGRVRELAMELAAPLPLCSGHGGLSFNASYDIPGAEGLRSRLHTPGTTVQEMEGDKVLITLGAWPEAGDTERGDTLPAYRELARVLESWRFHEPDRRLLGQSAEESRRWERRFLD